MTVWNQSSVATFCHQAKSATQLALYPLQMELFFHFSQDFHFLLAIRHISCQVFRQMIGLLRRQVCLVLSPDYFPSKFMISFLFLFHPKHFCYLSLSLFYYFVLKRLYLIMLFIKFIFLLHLNFECFLPDLFCFINFYLVVRLTENYQTNFLELLLWFISFFFILMKFTFIESTLKNCLYFFKYLLASFYQ